LPQVLQGALKALSQEAVVDPHGLHAEHRQALVPALFYKAYLALQDASRLPQRLRSAAVPVSFSFVFELVDSKSV
jgi:hypothetical protein